MKVGVSTSSLFNKVATESAFDVLRQIGVDLTEVFLNTFCEYEKDFVDQLAKQRGNINVHSVHALTTQFEPELFSFNSRVREDAEKTFRKVCYAGSVLGAKFYTFHGAARLKAQEYVFDYQRLGERTNQLIDIAGSYGINLSYENVHWCYFSNPEYFRLLSRECPRLYATLDIKQALQGGIEPIKFMDVMGNRISTVHLCDTRNRVTCMPGFGDFDFGKLFDELKLRKLHANMLLEVYSKDYTQFAELEAGYRHLQRILSNSLTKTTGDRE